MKINFKAVPEAMKVFGKLLEKNKSTILVGAGLLGWIGTAVLVGRAAPKAKTAIDKAKRDMYQNYEGEDMDEVALTPMETVKSTWQYYIPAVGLGVVSSAAIIYAHKLDLSKVASLVSTYQLTKGEYEKLKEKIVEKDGPEKLKEYRQGRVDDTLKNNPPTYIYDTGEGTSVFYEPMNKIYFYHDIWKVERILRSMVEDCRTDGMCSFDEVLTNLGLKITPLTADYAFYEEGVRDIGGNNIHDLFIYQSLDAKNGDLRPCIYLDFKDRISNVNDYAEDAGRPFRRRGY